MENDIYTWKEDCHTKRIIFGFLVVAAVIILAVAYVLNFGKGCEIDKQNELVHADNDEIGLTPGTFVTNEDSTQVVSGLISSVFDHGLSITDVRGDKDVMLAPNTQFEVVTCRVTSEEEKEALITSAIGSDQICETGPADISSLAVGLYASVFLIENSELAEKIVITKNQ